MGQIKLGSDRNSSGVGTLTTKRKLRHTQAEEEKYEYKYTRTHTLTNTHAHLVKNSRVCGRVQDKFQFLFSFDFVLGADLEYLYAS